MQTGLRMLYGLASPWLFNGCGGIKRRLRSVVMSYQPHRFRGERGFRNNTAQPPIQCQKLFQGIPMEGPLNIYLEIVSDRRCATPLTLQKSIKNTNAPARRPMFKSRSHQLLVVTPQACYPISLCLSFCACKLEIVTVESCYKYTYIHKGYVLLRKVLCI